MWNRLGTSLAAILIAALLSGSNLSCNRAEQSNADSGDGTSSKTEKPEKKKKFWGKNSEPVEKEEDQSVPVEITELSRGRIESILRFSTNLEAENEVQVISEAARKIRSLLVEEGDDVRQNQVLIRLQDEEQRNEIARVESQLANARREYERRTNLYGQQLISEQDYNQATYDLEQFEIALKDAQRQLSYTEVRAPISGTITQRMINIGDQISVNQHLFDIVDFDSIVARIYVPEKELYRIRPGQSARIFADAASGEERFGSIDRIAPRVDPRSGTIKVTVSIPRSQGLLPGMYVTAELITEVHEDALLLPKRAIVYDADQIFVFRLKDDSTVERLLIRPALQDRDNVEPAGTLNEGDRIVIAGQASLKDGSEVRIVGGTAPVETASN
jgi:membrane fusion protein (multidrug efflux system)